MEQIENYHLDKSKYGIISLIVNTVDNWVDYRYYHLSNGHNVILILKDNQEIDKLVIHDTEINFDKESYLRLKQQEDDQIIIYWIPKRLLL